MAITKWSIALGLHYGIDPTELDDRPDEQGDPAMLEKKQG